MTPRRRSDRDRALGAVLAALVALTLGSSVVAEDLPGLGVLRTVAVLAVVGVKLELVGGWFMELRDAPRLLRSLFRLWIAVVLTTLLVLYAGS